jgi:hypothetical protein
MTMRSYFIISQTFSCIPSVVQHTHEKEKMEDWYIRYRLVRGVLYIQDFGNLHFTQVASVQYLESRVCHLDLDRVFYRSPIYRSASHYRSGSLLAFSGQDDRSSWQNIEKNDSPQDHHSYRILFYLESDPYSFGVLFLYQIAVYRIRHSLLNQLCEGSCFRIFFRA